jgi:hypothetical protein
MNSQQALLEQAALYGKAGIWYDSVNLLAQLRKTQPSDQALALIGVRVARFSRIRCDRESAVAQVVLIVLNY